MRVLAGAAVFLVLLFLVPAGAKAHGAGTGPVAAEGDFVLSAAGSTGDSFRTAIAEMGLEAHTGATLRYFWSANNGSGAPVYFEIHDHAPPSGYHRHHSFTGLDERGEWTVPGSEEYLVLWQNMAAEPSFVSYSFSLLPAPPDFLPTLITVAAVGGFLAVLWLIWRGKGERPEEEREGRGND